MDWLIDRFNSFKDRDLIYSDDGLKTYSNLILQIDFY